MSGANPYAAPAAAVRDQPEGGFELAGRWTRLAAHIIDVLALLLPVWGIAAVGVYAGYVLEGGGADVESFPPWMIGAVVLAGLWVIGLSIFNLWSLHRRGQTLAKRLFRIRILRVDGSRAGLPRIFFLRFPLLVLSIYVPAGPLVGVIDALFIFRDDRRCVHDLIAGTIVIRA